MLETASSVIIAGGVTTAKQRIRKLPPTSCSGASSTDGGCSIMMEGPHTARCDVRTMVELGGARQKLHKSGTFLCRHGLFPGRDPHQAARATPRLRGDVRL